MRTRSAGQANTNFALEPTIHEQRRLALAELRDAISINDEDFIPFLFQNMAPELAIDTFLRKSRFYSLSQRRWKLPRSCAKLLDKDIHTPFLNILSSILKYFLGEITAEVTRELVDTHATDLRHREPNSTLHHSRPSLVIKAEGPSFQLPSTEPGQTLQKVGYCNIATCIDIQVDGSEFPISDQLVRATTYARQIFIHQPNRRFVRTVVLTEQHLRLFHFDRSGAQYSQPLDFHENPQTFVQVILGISSLDEAQVGLDTSIQWSKENGRKVKGTLTTRGANGEKVMYPLAAIDPIFSSSNVCGRSTTCWRVRDPTTNEEFVVKDSWRSEGRPSEHTFLEQAVGVSGVVQMVSYEPDRCQTKNLRLFGDSVPPKFRNKRETRIVMKAYGKSIRNYTSARQLSCALRDAIAVGHFGLFRKGTIHRDVSLQNILLGNPGAEPGNRGVLIDFDISTLRSSKKPADWRMGTRLYQSIPTLYSFKLTHPLPHDHIDDLESFLYVLVHIMFAQDPNGPRCEADKMLAEWEKSVDDCSMAAVKKEAYLTRRYVPFEIEKRWPSPCVDLIIAYAAFIQNLMLEKMELNQLKPGVRRDREDVIASEFEQHYNHILQLFDTAIGALDEPDTWRVVEDTDDERWQKPPTLPTVVYEDESSDEQESSRSSLKSAVVGDEPQVPDGVLLTTYISTLSNITEIQVNGRELSVEDQLVRATIYARRFVRVLGISESHLRLFHFDRSGAQYTPLHDFHEDPHTFVRLVLGLSSPDEFDVGLDASIQWVIEGGRKVEGTIRTRGADLQDIVYPLVQIEPFFFRGSISGRSTTCWKVRDSETNEQLLVKDMWRSEDRASEHTFLQEAIGLPGVVQMVNCEPDRCETKSLRGFGESPPRKFRNRIESRIVIKTYGRSVDRYTSAKQLFCALRDAIAGKILSPENTQTMFNSSSTGHLELFKKGIIHRDVSPFNILFGNPEAEPGFRGILIDFDIATRRIWKKPVDGKIVSSVFQP
ncbi:hypothetical protein MD484_g7263, partial [Candolleomyces efflorescens]